MSWDDLERGADLLRSARGVLVDWDGCLMRGPRPTPGAASFLENFRDRAVVLSNNSTELPNDFRTEVLRLGIDLPVERFVLAGRETIRLARTRMPDRRVDLLAGERMITFARSIGLNVTSVEADAVILLRDSEFSYAKLARAAAAIERGARLLVSNVDSAHPGEVNLIPETGALLAALRTATRIDDARVEIVGKPAPHLFRLAAQILGTDLEGCVMVGDNVETDGAGARALGIPFILVGPQSRLTLESLADACAPPSGAWRAAAGSRQ